MNAPFLNPPADRRAFLSLAATQRRLARQYRGWASEAEAAGNLEHFRRYDSEAKRLAQSSRWHFHRALST